MFDNLNTGIQMVTVFGHLTIISLVGLMRVSEYWTSLVLEWYIKSWSKKQTVWYSDAFLFNLHLRLTTRTIQARYFPLEMDLSAKQSDKCCVY